MRGDRLHARQSSPNTLNNVERRSVRALRYRDIDRSFAVYVSVADDDVRAALYRADVAQVDGGAAAQKNGGLEQIVELATQHGIGRCNTHQIARADRARRHDNA